MLQCYLGSFHPKLIKFAAQPGAVVILLHSFADEE